jgi:hypothetical protein
MGLLLICMKQEVIRFCSGQILNETRQNVSTAFDSVRIWSFVWGVQRVASEPQPAPGYYIRLTNLMGPSLAYEAESPSVTQEFLLNL